MSWASRCDENVTLHIISLWLTRVGRNLEIRNSLLDSTMYILMGHTSALGQNPDLPCLKQRLAQASLHVMDPISDQYLTTFIGDREDVWCRPIVPAFTPQHVFVQSQKTLMPRKEYNVYTFRPSQCHRVPKETNRGMHSVSHFDVQCLKFVEARSNTSVIMKGRKWLYIHLTAVM